MGEALAEKYLKKRLWRILSTNFQTPYGEIDLIGYRFGRLVFFEVKTRTNDKFGRPASAVDAQKIYKIKKAMNAFLQTYCIGGRVLVNYPLGIEKRKKIKNKRIDVIEVYISDNKPRINHIKSYSIGEEL